MFNAVHCLHGLLDLKKNNIKVSESVRELLQKLIEFYPKKRLSFHRLFYFFKINNNTTYEKLMS